MRPQNDRAQWAFAAQVHRKRRARRQDDKQMKKECRKKKPTFSSLNKPSAFQYRDTISPLLALSLTILSLSSFNHGQVSCSPPVDYFLYTSQSVANQPQSAAQLPPIDSIYNLTNNSSKAHLSAHEAHLNELAYRVRELVRNSSHSHDNNLIDLEATRFAWHLMEKQASLYMRTRIGQVRSVIKELLQESQASVECQGAIESWMDNMNELKQWAILMWNSWGQFPPTGVYEGSFTDLGSYRGCLSVKDNEIIGQAQYCALDLQPLVPTRPRFHSIFKRILSIDPQTNLLSGGDFGINNIGTRHTAHGFASTRFRAPNSLPVDEDAPSSSTSGAGSGKYNKRTIDSTAQQATASAAAATTTAPLSEQASAEASNLTLKAEALIELANKAQYFYYVRFRIGACLPSKCSQDDVRKLAQVAGQRAILQTNQVNCMKKEAVTLNGYQKTAIWILSSLALIAVLGTIVDLLGYKGTHGDLECVHGLRFFSMIWVIYGHTILYTEYQSFTHFYDVIERQIPSFILLPSLNANFSVDTFFVISGILTTYVTWEYTKGDARKFNKFAYLISRYIRLTPQLAIVILCFFLLPIFGDGPMYKQVSEDKADVCYKNWAINLLYLQSYINSDKLCIDPSWWLSIEMTFHFVSLIVIVAMINNPTKGMIVNAIVATILTLWGAVIHYTNGFAIQYLPSIPQRYEVSGEQTQVFFHRPYPHAASYFIGIALGYVLANRTVKKLTRTQVYQGWFVCALSLSICWWGSYYWNLGAPYSQLQATVYYNLCQILWPIGIAWIILACSLGHGGLVDSILSAKCFVPLGRITYMTYLSHALIIYFHSASMNIPVEPSMLLFVYLFIANTFLALMLGVVLTIVYESPLLNLQKLLLNYLTQKFDPTVKRQATRHLPTTIVCDKNGTSAASATLLPSRNDTHIVNCNGNAGNNNISK